MEMDFVLGNSAFYVEGGKKMTVGTKILPIFA